MLTSKHGLFAGLAAAAAAVYYFFVHKAPSTATGATITANTMPYFMPNVAQSTTSGIPNDPVATNAAPGTAPAAAPMGTATTLPYVVPEVFSNVSTGQQTGFLIDAAGNKVAGNSSWDGVGPAPDWAIRHVTPQSGAFVPNIV
jgi:hypothetical protein